MSKATDQDRQTPTDTLKGSLLFLLFGLSMLAFLVAIDRPEWFVLRPATGTAVAMSAAPKITPAKARTDQVELSRAPR